MKTMLRFSPVLFVAAFCFVLMGAIALGDTQGPKLAGTGSGWTNSSRITANDGSSASISINHGTNSTALTATNFSFSIPTGYIIDGIQVTIGRNGDDNSHLQDYSVYIVKGGSTTGTNHAAGGNWPSGEGAANYGATNDLWGTTWAAEDINSANFGVALSVHNSSSFASHTAYVDYIQITVTYEAPLPIQMASFAANVVRDNQVEVAWRTVSETNNYGFEIYRKRGDAGDWAKIGFVQGHGTTLAPQSYTYVDAGLSFGKYYYQIKQIDLDGKSETFPAMAVTVGVAPETMVLAQNYPNPFNPSTLIEFVVPMSGHATMKVYNVLGQEVATLFDGSAQAGTINTARFSAANLPSGLYFYTLRSAGQTETKRMLLTK
jgi:hypothetical protein